MTWQGLYEALSAADTLNVCHQGPPLNSRGERLLHYLRARRRRLNDQLLAIQLAEKFAEVMRNWLSAEELAEVRRRNAAEANAYICHTHDFCDANLAMAEAFIFVVGRDPISEDEHQSMSEADCALWNAAWSRAKGAL